MSEGWFKTLVLFTFTILKGGRMPLVMFVRHGEGKLVIYKQGYRK